MKRTLATPLPAALLALAVLASGSPLTAMHPNQPRGFDPERLYQGGVTDQFAPR